MTLAACALAWFFLVADLDEWFVRDAVRPVAVTRSEAFSDRADCERIARAVARLRPGLLVYEFEPGRQCFQAPVAERGR